VATNKEIVKSAYASFAAGDVPAALGAMADDIQWTEAARWQSCCLPAACRHPQGSRTQLTRRTSTPLDRQTVGLRCVDAHGRTARDDQQVVH